MRSDQPQSSTCKQLLLANWHWCFSAFAVLTGLAVVAEHHSPGMLTGFPGVAEIRAAARDTLPPWLGGDPRYRQAEEALAWADRASEAAMNDRLATLDAFFTAKQAGAADFAEEVLGIWSKLSYAGNLLVDAGNAIRTFFSGEISFEPDANQKLRYAMCEAFAEHIVGPDEIQKALSGAARGYLSDLQAIEAKLRGEAASAAQLPEANALAKATGYMPTAFDFEEASGIAAGDVGVGLVQYLIADQIGNVVMVSLDGLMSSLGLSGGIDWSARFAAGQGVDAVADAGLSSLSKQLGYDPAAKIIVHANAALRSAQRQLVDGSEETPGLRPRLRALHAERSKLRREAVARLLANTAD